MQNITTADIRMTAHRGHFGPGFKLGGSIGLSIVPPHHKATISFFLASNGVDCTPVVVLLRVPLDETRRPIWPNSQFTNSCFTLLQTYLVCVRIVLLNMMRQNFHSPSDCLLRIQRFFKLIFSIPPSDLVVRVALTVARANPQCPPVSTSS